MKIKDSKERSAFAILFQQNKNTITYNIYDNSNLTTVSSLTTE